VSVAREAEEIVGKVMPYGVSLLLHVGLLLIIAFATISMALEDIGGEKIIIPFAGVTPIPGAPPETLIKPKKPIEDWFPTPNTPRDSQLVSTNNPKDFGKDSGTGPTGSGSDHGSGPGKGGKPESSVGIGGAGDVGTKSGTPWGGESEPAFRKSRFMGLQGNATRIVYLIDASGTLIETLPFVVAELKNSVGNLSEKQSFTVIFFQGTDPKEVPRSGMKQANSANKTGVFNWIDSGKIIPQGGNNPVKAIQLALAYEPELIYILSDNITGNGIYQVDQRSFVRDIEKANRGRDGKQKAKINTIQFITPDPLEGYGMKGTLKQISENSGGVYKFLDAKELGIE
jgi:hypothetical protein